jgi:dienelactone hydrolase
MHDLNNSPEPNPSPNPHSRRNVLKAMILPAVGVSLTNSKTSNAATIAQQVPEPVSKQVAPTHEAKQLPPLNRFPRMVQEFFVQQVRDAEHKNVAALDALRTKADAEAYVQSVRKRIQESFGPFPERTPLNARVVKTIERDGYRIENVIFESRPGFPVTANLYVPANRDGLMPGVVGTCGHSANGKAAEPYQQFAQGLARIGMVCLIYDPIGQGERLQYVTEKLTSSKGAGVQEHLHGGNQQFLVGEFLCSWRAWDGIRALDYLLTRPEVDPNHVGVTGNSGGGTMTTWLTGVESRWTMSAPSCFVTTFRRNLENELPADTEQCPPRAIGLGLDHADFLAALAPRPVIILAKERDYFDVRGAEEAYERLRRLYAMLGAEQNVALFIGPTGHGYSLENREAMYSWFSRSSSRKNQIEVKEAAFDGVLRTAGDVPFVAEPPLVIETDETLWCTPNGQVAAIEGTRSVFHFTQEKSRQLAGSRKSLRGSALQAAIVEVLKIPASPAAPPDYRISRNLGSRGYPKPHSVAYTVDTEPGVQSIVYRLTDEEWLSRPPVGNPSAILYVAHLSSDAELRDEPLLQEVASANPMSAVYACDVRGIGESMPGTCGPDSFHKTYGCDYFYAVHGLMLDRPYLGQKTYDVLRVLEWLQSLGHTEIHLVARGWGALCGTFAAVLSPVVTRVTLKQALTSYSDIAETEDYHWPLATLPPNVLAHFDMPDCYAELAGKNLVQSEPANSEGCRL